MEDAVWTSWMACAGRDETTPPPATEPFALGLHATTLGPDDPLIVSVVQPDQATPCAARKGARISSNRNPSENRDAFGSGLVPRPHVPAVTTLPGVGVSFTPDPLFLERLAEAPPGRKS